MPGASQDATLLRPGRDSLSVALVRGRDTAVTGWGRDELSVRSDSGVRVLFRVFEIHDPLLGSQVDTIRDLLPSLTPLSHVERRERMRTTMTIRGGQGKGWLRIGSGDSVALAIAVPAEGINAASFDLVIRAAPLDSAWHWSGSGIVAAMQSMVKMEARVAAAEELAGEAAWRVEATFAGMPVTFWIRTRDHRMLLERMQLSSGDVLLIRSIAQ